MTHAPRHIEIFYDRENKLFINRVRGLLRLADVRQNVEEIIQHPDFVPGTDTLWDLTHARIEELSISELTTTANPDLIREDIEDEPKFAVVTADALQFGLARQLITFTFPDIPNVQVFMSMDKALDWLRS